MSNVRTLKEFSTLKTGPFGTQFKASEYVPEGIPVINVKNIGYGNIVRDNLDHISERTRDRLSEHVLQRGDIVFGRKGSVDRHCLITEAEEGWFQGSDCLRVRITDPAVDPQYVSYYLLSSHVLKAINNAAVGSTMASLNMDIIGDIKITLPSYEKQCKIAAVLKALDDKRAINTAVNDNLQQMAKTIYDYWFTQFDFPNNDGKPYRSSGGPMVWDDNLKKEIPQGWTSGQLSDIANIAMGQSPEGSTYNEEQNGTVFFQGCTDFGNRFPEPRVYTTAPTRFAKAGDILMSVRAPVGTLNIALEDCCIGRGLAALNSKFGSQLHLMYTLVMFKSHFDIMDSNGTTFGSITKDELYEMKVVIPPAEQMEAFERMVQPIEQKIKQCELENRELTRQRNWLLPMLMNGQASVSD